MYKIFLNAAKLIEKSRNDVQFVFSKSKSLKDSTFSAPYLTLRDENYELLAYSDALILASGTVALEAAIYKTPMVIAYKGPLLFYLIYLLVRNIKRACLVNIITKQDYIDEFLMFDATADKIAKGINEILDNDTKRNYIIEGCQKTIDLLSGGNCTKNVANVIKNELNGEVL